MALGAVPVWTWSVLGEGRVTDVVQRLDAPVPSDVVGQAGGACLGGGEVGDRVDRHGAPAATAKRPGPAGDADRLGGVGEVQAGDGGGLHRHGMHQRRLPGGCSPPRPIAGNRRERRMRGRAASAPPNAV